MSYSTKMKPNLRLITPSTMIITGSSNVGKTRLTEQIVCNHSEVFLKPFDEIRWIHGRHAADPSMFDRMTKSLRKQNVPIFFHDEIPVVAIENNELFTKPKSAMKLLG